MDGRNDAFREGSAYKSQRVSEVSIDNEVVVYHEELQTVHVLNPTAALVWEMLDSSAIIDEVAVALASQFEIDRETLVRDVMEIVRRFGEQGLLEGVRPKPSVVAELRRGSPPLPDIDPERPGEQQPPALPRRSPRYIARPPDG